MEALDKAFLENKINNIEMSQKTWKLTATIKKQNMDLEGEEEQCQMQVEIFKVKDQEKHCVNFQRKAGSAILFYDNANLIISELNLLNDTTFEQ